MLAEAGRRVWLESRSFVALVRAGLVGIEPPRRLLSMLRAQRDFGPVGAAPRNAALRYGSCPAIANERGELTFAELDEQVNRLANALRAEGLAAGSSLGILCRTPRWPLIAACAAARLGMHTISLTTAPS